MTLLRFLVVGVALVVCQPGPAGAQAPTPDPWLTPASAGAFDVRRGPDTPVRIAVPKNNWMVLPTGRSVIFVMAAKKGDADVMVERAPLALALEPDDVTDVLAQIQVDAIKAREPRAAEFEARVLEAGARRLVAVQYRRPGSLGLERVRQYSLPVGHWLYHITCASTLDQFPSYEAMFSHIASSFAATE